MDAEIKVLPLLHMASGDMLSLQQYRLVGAHPGKVVYLQANLHGAEIAGNSVIHQLLTYFQKLDATALQGEIRLVPACNPIGVNTRAHNFASGRFNPYDGRDWNRIFWDWEQEHQGARTFAEQHLASDRATIQQAYREFIGQHFKAELATLDDPAGVPVHQRYRTRLQQQALAADLLIDLHSSSNQGLVYAYYFRDRTASIPYFDLDFAILLDQFDGNAFDEAFINPWLALEQAFAELGRSLRFDIEAWTLELGTGMKNDPQAIARGVNGILNYLRQQQVLQDGGGIVPRSVPLTRASQLKKYYATAGGFVQNRVALGTWVQSGDVLYELLCLNKTGQYPQVLTVQAQQSGLVYDLSTCEGVSEGEYVLAVMVPDA
ncbi:succinylglutamate desuccinylase/aspartoacylase family protein [Leptolyngbya iicbica]|uniref:Succinylglutamate desuccinylase n=2 Tax=Cyanophyceae TaxID=3028117 RepID=A0A4Q7E7T5_9CYAN|nr:succinylglutamate desuccinylase/aspartoacylase family protein [Leptolyngbya sp. LK]RZM76685.1 succinylglutamate desuccinylase [Leptolyngbya sp. LK]